MSRLTEKRWYGFYGYEVYETYPEDIEKVNNKLGQLEDIEEKHDMSLDEIDAYITSHKQIEKELGIDLIKLFYIRKHPYVYSTIHKKVVLVRINFYEDYLTVFGDDNELTNKLYYEDYGKTWARTKEELKNE